MRSAEEDGRDAADHGVVLLENRTLLIGNHHISVAIAQIVSHQRQDVLLDLQIRSHRRSVVVRPCGGSDEIDLRRLVVEEERNCALVEALHRHRNLNALSLWRKELDSLVRTRRQRPVRNDLASEDYSW